MAYSQQAADARKDCYRGHIPGDTSHYDLGSRSDKIERGWVDALSGLRFDMWPREGGEGEV